MFNLKMFDAVTYTAEQGKDIIILLRPLNKATAQAAALVPFGTSDTESISADTDQTVTKDGVIGTAGSASVELSKEGLMHHNTADPDGTISLDDLKAAMKNREKVEAWVINLSRPAATSGKYLGTYYQGYLTSFETEAAAEDLATVSMDYSADGIGADGDCTVDATTREIAAYVFKDTVKQVLDVL